MNISGLICGLGNPGSKYSRNRHNAGFMVLDRLIESARKPPDESVRLKTESPGYLLFEWEKAYGSERWLLLKPMAYMNRSGAAVSKIFSGLNIETHRLMVIHDEVDLPLGTLMLKHGGGLAGHNGLRSIADAMGTRDFSRLRFGVGRPETGYDLSAYVLDNFMPEERKLCDLALNTAVEVIRNFCMLNLDAGPPAPEKYRPAQ
jgi:peptidyl-tRNA hydrolase, PTH1 family